MRQWDVKSGKQVRRFIGHTGQIYQIIVHGPTIFTCSTDATVRVWNIIGGMEAVFQHGDSVNCMQLFRTSLFTGSNDRKIREWDTQSLTTKCTYVGGVSGVNCLQFVEEQGFIFAGCADGVVRVWRRGVAEISCMLEGHTSSVNQMVTSRKLRGSNVSVVVVTGDASGGLRVWDGLRGLPIRVLQPHDDAINYMVAEDQAIFTASRDKTQRHYDPHRGTLLRSFRGSSSTVRTVAATSKLLIGAGKDNTVRCFDVGTGRMRWNFDGHKDYINRAIIRGDDVFTAGRDFTIRRWRLRDGKLKNVYAGTTTRLMGEWEPRIEFVIGLVTMLVEFFQLASLVFVPTVPWWKSHPAVAIAPPFRFDFTKWIPQDMMFYPPFFGFLGAMLLYGLLFARAPKYKDARAGSFRRVIMWPLTIAACWLMTAILFVPAVKAMVSVFRCYGDTLPDAHQFQCWKGTHWVFVALAILGLVAYLPLAMRLIYVEGMVHNAAVYFWSPKKWSQDKPDVRRISVLSRRSMKINQPLLIVTFVNTCASVLLLASDVEGSSSSSSTSTTSVPYGRLIALCVILIAAACLAVGAIVWDPPYHWDRANFLKVSLSCGVVWTYIMATITVHVHDSSVAWPSIVHLAGLPAVFLLGCVMMARRMWGRRMHRQWIQRMIFDERGMPSRSHCMFEKQPPANAFPEKPPSGVARIHCKTCNTNIPREWWDSHLASLKHKENTRRMQEAEAEAAMETGAVHDAEERAEEELFNEMVAKGDTMPKEPPASKLREFAWTELSEWFGQTKRDPATDQEATTDESSPPSPPLPSEQRRNDDDDDDDEDSSDDSH
jgi:hypothetical protein